MEWKHEYNVFAFLIALTIFSMAFGKYGVFGFDLIASISGAVAMMFALYLARPYVEKLSKEAGKYYDLSILSVIIILSGIFLRALTDVLNITAIYGDYLMGLGYALAFIFLLVSGLYGIYKRLS